MIRFTEVKSTESGLCANRDFSAITDEIEGAFQTAFPQP